NTENWGLSKGGKLSIVDFSFGSPENRWTKVGLAWERKSGQDERRFILRKPSHDVPQLQIEGELLATDVQEFLTEYGKWFANAAAFKKLLYTAIDEVTEWYDGVQLPRHQRQYASYLEDLKQFRNAAVTAFA